MFRRAELRSVIRDLSRTAASELQLFHPLTIHRSTPTVPVAGDLTTRALLGSSTLMMRLVLNRQ